MLLWLTGLGAVAGVVGAYCLGYARGSRAFWHELQTNRVAATFALEKLAKVHGAKIEMDDFGAN